MNAFSISTVVPGNNCTCREKQIPHSLSKLHDDLGAKGQSGRKLHDHNDCNSLFRQKKHRSLFDISIYLKKKKKFSVKKISLSFDFYYSLKFKRIYFHSHPYKRKLNIISTLLQNYLDSVIPFCTYSDVLLMFNF